MAPLLVALLAGCTPADEAPIDTLPPEETDLPRDTDPVEFPEDTSLDSDLDVTPEHTLTLHQWGFWDLSTPDVVTGTLRYQEWVDGDGPDNDTADTAPPWPADTDELLLPICDMTITLAGVPATATPACAGCDAPWEITFTYAEGDRFACHDAELPADGATRVLAFHAVDEKVKLNFGNIGVWLDWYDATRGVERIDFDWIATVGVAIDEDMDN